MGQHAQQRIRSNAAGRVGRGGGVRRRGGAQAGQLLGRVGAGGAVHKPRGGQAAQESLHSRTGQPQAQKVAGRGGQQRHPAAAQQDIARSAAARRRAAQLQQAPPAGKYADPQPFAVQRQRRFPLQLARFAHGAALFPVKYQF